MRKHVRAVDANWCQLRMPGTMSDLVEKTLHYLFIADTSRKELQ